MTTDPLAGLAPEARVRLEVFWEIVKRMNPVTATEWDAARQQTLLTETMILDGAASRTAEPTLALPAPPPAPPPPEEPHDEFIEQPPLPAREPEPEQPRAATVNPFAPKPEATPPVHYGKLRADDLAAIRPRYEAGESVPVIAADFKVTEAAIRLRAKALGWIRPPRLAPQPKAARPTESAPPPPVSRETPRPPAATASPPSRPPAKPPTGLSGNGIATKNKIRAAALAAGVGVERAPTMQIVDAAARLRGAGHRVTRLPLEGKWRVDDREPMSLPELERLARQVSP